MDERPTSSELASTRPPEVSVAVLLLWIQVGLGVASAAWDWQYIKSLGPPAQIHTIQVVSLVVIVWLIHKISSGRNWARITFLVIWIIGLPMTLTLLPGTFERSSPTGAVHALTLLLHVTVFYLIFASPGRRWFRRRKEANAVA